MNTDTLSIIHYAVSGLTAIGGVALAYLHLQEKKLKRTDVKEDEFQDLQTRVAVLEDRSIREREAIDNKLDEILRHL
jgi:hypothetical protein